MERHKKILIARESVLADIQKTFNSWYPYLKIDFLGNADNGSILKSVKLDPETSVSNLKSAGSITSINIGFNKSVAEFAHEVEATLGVIVQVSRKAGNFWHQISATHWWTLESQNEAGKIISSKMNSQPREVLSASFA